MRVFFSYPFRREGGILSFILKDPKLLQKELGNQIGELNAEMKRIIESVNLYLAFNAIRYNIPLAFLHHEEVLKFDERKEEDIKKALQELKRLIDKLMNRRIEREDNNIRITYRPLDHRKILSIYLTQALGTSIFRFWKEEFKPLIVYDTDGKWVDIRKLLKLFREVYARLNFNLNSRFLERDVVEICSFKNNPKLKEGPKRLTELLKNKRENQRGKGKNNEKRREALIVFSDIKRNFFAHSGFLREITLVKKINDTMLVKWEPAKNITFNTIKEWLKRPES